MGCYSLQPMRGEAPEPGSRIAFDVNDQGRVALGGSMGPEIDQIEGRLVQRDSANYLIAVTAVHLLRGGDQVWSGEHVRVNSSYVSRVYARRFSSGKTLALSAVGVGAIGVFVAQSLTSAGMENNNSGPGDSAAAVRFPSGRRVLQRIGRQRRITLGIRLGLP